MCPILLVFLRCCVLSILRQSTAVESDYPTYSVQLRLPRQHRHRFESQLWAGSCTSVASGPSRCETQSCSTPRHAARSRSSTQGTVVTKGTASRAATRRVDRMTCPRRAVQRAKRWLRLVARSAMAGRVQGDGRKNQKAVSRYAEVGAISVHKFHLVRTHLRLRSCFC